jgi:hypothetical protein
MAAPLYAPMCIYVCVCVCPRFFDVITLSWTIDLLCSIARSLVNDDLEQRRLKEVVVAS